jgi:hypothetical protein
MSRYRAASSGGADQAVLRRRTVAGGSPTVGAESAICADCDELMTGCLLQSGYRRCRCPFAERHAAKRPMYAGSSLFPYPPQGHTSTVWLPAWLPNPKKGAGVRTLSCAPSRTRTYGLLLRRHFRSVAGRCQVWPDVPFGCSGYSWGWPGVALCLWSLAPRLAPRDLVSSANVRMIRTDASPSTAPAGNPSGLSRAGPRPRRWLPGATSGMAWTPRAGPSRPGPHPLAPLATR